ncbi:hypothetical protein [Actinoplanes sp. NPDC020271]|uniref:hypothetical protein n=1 Tax=Actinoplanes sp. NPDC020271 TaxID=3363896 RepID=UPI0037A70584
MSTAGASGGTAMVFRDSSGRVVGGAIDGIGDQRHCGTDDYDLTGSAGGIPEGAGEARTVVSGYCDVARPEGGVCRPSGAPAN